MKNFILPILCITFLLASFELKAQIRMADDGNVSIGNISPSSINDLNVAEGIFTWGPVGIGTSAIPEYSLRLAPAPSGIYSLFVIGTTYCTGGQWTASDLTLKKNIQSITAPIEKIKQLKGRNYFFKSQAELGNVCKKENNGVDQEDIWMINSEGDTLRITANDDFFDLPDGKCYGLIAQEVKDVVPELVRFDSTNGTYAIEYDGFIPILIEGLKVQQAEIDSLKALVSAHGQYIIALESLVEELQLACCDSKLKSTSSPISSEIKVNTLYQNAPNPFSQSTTIEYSLAENVRKAMICIYDMNGTQLKCIPLNLTGYGNITIIGSELKAGMYMYSLIADGQLIDTKRMVLTD